MGAPLFSVVMPAYNTARMVGPAIRSVLAQSCPDFELIVVDDGSTDNTPARIRSFASDPRVRVVRHENRGLSAARNTGIELARGEYVSFLDSDDLWMPSYLEVMDQALGSNPAAGLGYTDAWVLNDETRRIYRGTAMSSSRPPAEPPPDAEALLELLVQRNFIFSAATVRRSVLEHVGLFDTRLQAAEDWEMWLRIVAHGYRVVRPPGLLAIYRWRRDSLSKDETSFAANIRRVLQMVIEEYPISDEIRALARRRARQLDSDRSPWGRRRTAVKRRGAAVKNALLGPRMWYDVPPAEVSSVFPDPSAL